MGGATVEQVQTHKMVMPEGNDGLLSILWGKILALGPERQVENMLLSQLGVLTTGCCEIKIDAIQQGSMKY